MNGSETMQTDLARLSIGLLLDGKRPNATTPAQLGPFSELYAEMLRAHQTGGHQSARRVYVAYAERDSAVAALRAAEPEPPKRIWTADDLLGANFPEPRWTIPDILPSGLCFLGGRPKQGKSWMALQFAMAVGSGGRTLDKPITQGRVLYLALEDGPRRLQSRLQKQRTERGASVDFRFEWRPLSDGGAADLLEAIDQERYTFVIIDTLSRAFGRADQMDLADMTVATGSLQRMAIDRDMTILAVDHHRKSAEGNAAGNVIDDVMGSTGKTGAADAVLGIYRERGRKDATLKLTGRDVEEQEFAIKFDHELGCWQMLGDASGVKAESAQADIVTCMEQLGGTATITQAAKWLGKQAPNVAREMQELVAKGIVERLEKSGKEVPYRLKAQAEGAAEGAAE